LDADFLQRFNGRMKKKLRFAMPWLLKKALLQVMTAFEAPYPAEFTTFEPLEIL
jgi:hypothetical protein